MTTTIMAALLDTLRTVRKMLSKIGVMTVGGKYVWQGGGEYQGWRPFFSVASSSMARSSDSSRLESFWCSRQWATMGSNAP